MSRRLDRNYLELLLVLVSVLSLLPKLFDSLWLDEFAIVAATKGSFWAAVTFRWMDLFVSPLFYGTSWVIVKFFGNSEAILRCSSLIFYILSCIAFYLLARKVLKDGWMPWAATVLFMNMPVVRDQAVTARPYTLGTLLVIIGVHVYIQSRPARFSNLLLSALAFSLALYSHLLFILIPVAIQLAELVESPKANFKKILLFTILFAMFTFPLGLDMIVLWGARETFYYQSSFRWNTLFLESWPVLAVFIWDQLSRNPKWKMSVSNCVQTLKPHYWIFVSWCALPPITLVLVSYFGSADIAYFGRYLMGTTPAFAILIATIFGSTTSQWLRRSYLILAFAILNMLPSGSPLLPRTFEQDWRGVGRMINSKIPLDRSVALFGCWAEPNDLGRLNDSKFREWFSLPLRYYGVKNRLILLPSDVNTEAQRQYVLSSVQVPEHGEPLYSVPCYYKYSLIPYLKAEAPNRWIESQMGEFGMIPLFQYALHN